MTDLPPASSRWFQVGGTDVRLLRDGREAFPAMLEEIAAARREILLEMYWIGDDPVGVRFREALAAAARRGVTVKVIYDAVGSMAIGPDFFAPIAKAGGQVYDYHPLFPLSPRFNLQLIDQRDHRKMLVVDGEMGFTGGINLAAEWSPREHGGKGWRDDMIQVRGIATLELRTLFYKTWRRLAFELGPTDLLPLRRSRSNPVRVLASQRRSRRSIHAEYVSRIQGARSSIDISNAYFVPDRRVQRALARAAERRVRIRILVAERGDVPMVQFAQEGLYDRLLVKGVELYVHAGPMMHAKTAIIDEAFVTIGTYNLDERSIRNLEVNIAVEDAAFCAWVRGYFEQDVARARRLDLSTWRDRSLARRGLERVALALRRFM